MQLGGPDDEDAVTLEIKVDLQLILSTLCESDLHRKVTVTLAGANVHLCLIICIECIHEFTCPVCQTLIRFYSKQRNSYEIQFHL